MSSGIVLNVRTNFPAVVAQLNQVSDDIGNKAMVRSLNTTIEQGKTQMARQISQEFRISVSKAKDRLEVSKASVKGGALRFEAFLEATKRGQGRSMNMIAFVGTLPRRTKKGKLSQVKFQVKRGGGKKILPGAFIGNKDRTMFIRTGNARLPIVPVNTIGVPSMFNTKRINAAVRKVMLERFEQNFTRELRVILGGFLK